MFWASGKLQPHLTLSIAGRAIAQRIIFSDHLGSLIAMQDSSGGLTAGSRAYYYPFGDYRGTPPSQTLTDMGFTGQKSNNQPAGDLGLIYMNARYYIPATGRFASPDTLIPNPQSYNRYSYVLNNPIFLTDPTGHYAQFSMIFETGPDWYANQMYEHALSDGALMNILGIEMADAMPDSIEIAASIIFEPIDWVASGIEMYVAVQEGDWATAAMIGVAAALPFASGSMVDDGVELVAKYGDDIGDFFQHADNVPAFPCGIGHSFSQDTVVATPDGLTPISQLERGDDVLAYDETTGETSYETIEAAWVHLDPLIVHLTIEGETIETTPNHPFYTERGWIEAGELWIGAAIYTANGNYGHVQAIQLAPTPQPMYDLTVATTHTFFVGAGQWLVHNCDFIVTPNGDAIPVPSGASGPNLAQNGKGFVFSGGSGGNYLAPEVSGVRVMDPTLPKAPSPGYPNGYVSYFNEANQTLNPYTGKPIPRNSPWWHIPLKGPQ